MLIFDFDGVIIDSLDEVAVNTYNTVTGELASSLGELPPNFVELFKLNRFHVQPAGDFPVLGIWCLHNATRLNPDHLMPRSEFKELLEIAPGTVKDRAEHFFETRTRLVEQNRQAWLALNRPYEPIFSALKQRGERRLLILTNKNRAAVLELFSHFGLECDPADICAGDNGVTKLDNFRALQQRFPGERFQFIDDSIQNILELRELFAPGELEMLLAVWGYLGPDDRKLAEREQIRAVGQEEAIRLFQGL